MSQNMMTKQVAVESEEAITKEPTSVDSYAERLMDELFEDVDRALESSTGLPTQPVQPTEFVSLKPIVVPQIILPTPGMSFQENNIDVEAIARKEILIAKQREAKESFDRLLLGAAFASLLLTFGLWLASKNGLGSTTNNASALLASQTAAAAKAEADVKFGAYMQQSLETLDQKKAAAKPKNTGLLGAPLAANLPTIGVPAAPPAGAGLTQAINRVADAIEQVSTQPGIPPTQVVIVPPAVTASPTAVAVKPANVGSPVTAREPKSIGERALAPEAAPAPVTILSPQEQPAPAPEAAAEPQPAPSTSTSPTATSDVPTVTHTLVGVLELGEKSAALFEIEGVARRIYVGESIGASGWTLAEVKNQEAIIRKGGEVRSIFVGQKF